MKSYLIILSLLINFLSYLCAQSPGPDGWPLQNDAMNFAILVSDFRTYEFEEGHFSIHEPCENCDADGLPFEMEYAAPNDTGYIIIRYTETHETLFSAGLWWAGQGRINFPRQFLSADSFMTTSTDVPTPLSTEYYDFMLVIDDSRLKVKADSAWFFVKSLDIVEDFSAQPYRIGIYLYPPTVGAFEPSVAKWIIFLYRGKTPISGVEQPPLSPHHFALFQNYPNPFNPSTKITYELPDVTNVRLEIYNVHGERIRVLVNQEQTPGVKTVEWHGKDDKGKLVPTGIYYYKVTATEFSQVRKMLLIK